VKSELTISVLLFFCLAAPRPLLAQEPAAGRPKLTQGSNPHSAATRSIREDHFHLAEYFRDLAGREQALAKSYDRLAKMYRERTVPPGLDPALAREMRIQYKRLAELEKKAAEAAVTVAEYHARLAELVQRVPKAAATKQVNPQDSAFRR
jgi:uncharacterized coiled-coil protein SlyX